MKKINKLYYRLKSFLGAGSQKRFMRYFFISGALVLTCVFILISASISIDYKNNIGNHYKQIASLISHNLDIFLKGLLVDTDSIIHSDVIIDNLSMSNKSHIDQSESEMMKEALSLDRQWREANEDNTLVSRVLHSPSSMLMRTYQDANQKLFKEVFITDKDGWLVGATKKITDFYQADELWWQEAYNNGRGKDYLSNIEYNDSARAWGFTLARPIFNENKKIVGIIKSIISHAYINELIQSENQLKAMHVSVVDCNGSVILDSVLVPGTLENKYDAHVVDTIRNNLHGGYCIGDNLVHKSALIGFYPVLNQLLDQNAIEWQVLCLQPLDVAITPVKRFLFIMIWLYVVSLIILYVVGISVSKTYIRTILYLKNAVEAVHNGNVSKKIVVRSNDEIERLAYLFNELRKMLNSREKLLGCRANEIAAICDIGKSVAYKKDYEDVVDKIVGLIVENRNMQVESISVTLYGADLVKNILLRKAQSGLMDGTSFVDIAQIDPEIASIVIDNKNTLSAPNVSQDKFIEEFLFMVYQHRGIHSAYMYPLVCKSGILGVLIIASVLPLSITSDEDTILRIVSELISLGVENEKLFKDMFEKHWEMYWLHEAALIMSSVSDFETVVSGITKIMMASCKAEKIVFIPISNSVEISKPGLVYEVYGGHTVPEKTEELIQVLKEYSIKKGRFTQACEHIDRNDPKLEKSAAWKQYKKSVSSDIVIPVYQKDNKSVIGVFFVFSQRDDLFTEERAQKLLSTYAQYVSTSFSNYSAIKNKKP